jgi:hypothetical protein
MASLPYALTATQEWHAELDVLHVCSSAESSHSKLMNDLSIRIDTLLVLLCYKVDSSCST